MRIPKSVSGSVFLCIILTLPSPLHVQDSKRSGGLTLSGDDPKIATYKHNLRDLAQLWVGTEWLRG
jgi:hypothetical protein